MNNNEIADSIVELLDEIGDKARRNNIPVIFLTSKDEAATVKALLELKPQGYLLKNQTKEAISCQISNFFVMERMK